MQHKSLRSRAVSSKQVIVMPLKLPLRCRLKLDYPKVSYLGYSHPRKLPSIHLRPFNTNMRRNQNR
jgi:hypothetical protein